MRIFVSSTSEDLKPYRRAAIEVIQNLRHTAVNMEDPEPDSNVGVVQACLRDVDSSDALLAIVAMRRGWVPPVERGGNGQDSITKLEIDRADGERPWTLLMAEESWPGNLCEQEDDAREWIRSFRADLDRRARWFEHEKDPALPNFRSKVRQAVLDLTQPPAASVIVAPPSPGEDPGLTRHRVHALERLGNPGAQRYLTDLGAHLVAKAAASAPVFSSPQTVYTWARSCGADPSRELLEAILHLPLPRGSHDARLAVAEAIFELVKMAFGQILLANTRCAQTGPSGLKGKVVRVQELRSQPEAVKSSEEDSRLDAYVAIVTLTLFGGSDSFGGLSNSAIEPETIRRLKAVSAGETNQLDSYVREVASETKRRLPTASMTAEGAGKLSHDEEIDLNVGLQFLKGQGKSVAYLITDPKHHAIAEQFARNFSVHLVTVTDDLTDRDFLRELTTTFALHRGRLHDYVMKS